MSSTSIKRRYKLASLDKLPLPASLPPPKKKAKKKAGAEALRPFKACLSGDQTGKDCLYRRSIELYHSCNAYKA